MSDEENATAINIITMIKVAEQLRHRSKELKEEIATNGYSQVLVPVATPALGIIPTKEGMIDVKGEARAKEKEKEKAKKARKRKLGPGHQRQELEENPLPEKITALFAGTSCEALAQGEPTATFGIRSYAKHGRKAIARTGAHAPFGISSFQSQWQQQRTHPSLRPSLKPKTKQNPRRKQ